MMPENIVPHAAATVASVFFTPLQRLGKDVTARLPHVTYEPLLVYGGDKGQRTVASVIPWAEIHDVRW